MKQVMKRTSLVLLALLSSKCFAVPENPAKDSPESFDVNSEPLKDSYGNPVAAPEPNKEPTEEIDYDNTFDLLKDFLDLSVKKDKNMKYWSKQLMALIRKKNKGDREKLAPFIRDFHNAHSTRDALGLGMAFRNHKEKFKEPKLVAHIDKMIKRDGLNNLLIILKHRMNIKG